MSEHVVVVGAGLSGLAAAATGLAQRCPKVAEDDAGALRHGIGPNAFAEDFLADLNVEEILAVTFTVDCAVNHLNAGCATLEDCLTWYCEIAIIRSKSRSAFSVVVGQ